MLFSEVYSAYFNAVAAILQEAVEGEISEKRITEIIGKTAFSESVLELLPLSRYEDWLLINRDLKTPIKKSPRMPLTTSQKRWLKALSLDPRVQLFEPDTSRLADVAPLFNPSDFVYFDRYADGDPFTDERYVRNFRAILTALKERRKIKIHQDNRHGRRVSGTFIPCKIEYSSKDDKFRLIAAGNRHGYTINLARVVECELLEKYGEKPATPPKERRAALQFELVDERKALERVMLHFSDCRKETRRLSSDKYLVTLWYHPQDVTEMVIRILSFGPMIKVLSPDSFVSLVRERIERQKNLLKGCEK